MISAKKKEKIFILFIIIVISFATAFFISEDDYLFRPSEVHSFNDNWLYGNEKISFAEGISGLEAKQEYTIKNTIPEDYRDSYELLIRSSLADIKVEVDGKPIYIETIKKSGIFQTPNASLWHIINLPDSSNSKTLAITFMSPYKSINGMINPIVYGNHSDLLMYLILKYGPDFALDIVILLLGVAMIIISSIMKKNSNNNLLCIGVFGILISLWLIAESKLLQFFTGSQIILGSLAYICLPIIPIPLLYYIKNIISDSKQRAINIAVHFSWLNLAVVVIMQSLNKLDFFETLPLTHIYMSFLIILVLKLIYDEMKGHKNETANNFFWSLILLFSFIIIELVRFYFVGITDVTIFVRLGLLLFVFSLGIQSFKQMIIMLKKGYRAEFYKKMAYMDQLTQGQNRMAFEKKLKAMFHNSKKLGKLRLVFLDMNDLKNINDTHGHMTGDIAIKNAYEIIDKSFHKLGKSYRIGGDEFAIIIPNASDEEFNSANKVFQENMYKHNSACTYPFGIALGSVTYESDKDASAEKMIHRADKKMYQEKINQYK